MINISIVIGSIKAKRRINFPSGTIGPGGGSADGTGSEGVLGTGGTNGESAVIGIVTTVVDGGALTFVELVVGYGGTLVVVPGDLGRGAGVVVDTNLIDGTVKIIVIINSDRKSVV